MKEKLKKFIFPTAITIPFLAIYCYFALPVINLRAGSFWLMLIITSALYLLCYISRNNPGFFKRIGSLLKLEKAHNSGKRKRDIIVDDSKTLRRGLKITGIVVCAVLAVVFVLCFVSSTRVFRADRYNSMLTVTESDFSEDIAELPISQIPVVDRDTAERLGSRKIGEVVELVSQFNVSSYYSQINMNNKPVRVSPLEYAGLLKWFSNKDGGIPYYVYIDMATQETRLVELEDSIKYSPSEYFSRDLTRHLRFAYPTKLFESFSFEVDDAGHPYWVAPYYTYTIGIIGGKDIAGIVLVDAVSGEMTDYSVEEVPQWIDRVYPADMLLEQANNWGSLKNGFFNSMFVQKNVVVTTDGYNYIAVDDDVWLYTGITSVVSDQSNIGFILINMRTKEAKTYMINGAEEYSAMESAEGQVQEKGYTATFPILINVADRPSYFVSLKDNAGLVKMYAFVSVADYRIVGVADTIEGAKNEYTRMLGVGSGEHVDPDLTEIKGTVSGIATAVVDGNSVYYIKIGDDIYTADIGISYLLPFIKEGDNVVLKVSEKTVRTIEMAP